MLPQLSTSPVWVPMQYRHSCPAFELTANDSTSPLSCSCMCCLQLACIQKLLHGEAFMYTGLDTLDCNYRAIGIQQALCTPAEGPRSHDVQSGLNSNPTDLSPLARLHHPEVTHVSYATQLSQFCQERRDDTSTRHVDETDHKQMRHMLHWCMNSMQ